MCDPYNPKVHWKHDAPKIGEPAPVRGEGRNQDFIDEYHFVLNLAPQEKNGFARVSAEGGAENTVRY